MNHLTEINRYLKRALKGKIGITKGLVIAFAITGGVIYGVEDKIDKKPIIIASGSETVIIEENEIITEAAYVTSSTSIVAGGYVHKTAKEAVLINKGVINISKENWNGPTSASNVMGMYAKGGTIINEGEILLDGRFGMRGDLDNPTGTNDSRRVDVENRGLIENKGQQGMGARIRGGKAEDEKLLNLINRGIVANKQGGTDSASNGRMGIYAEIVNGSKGEETHKGTINITNAAEGIIRNEGHNGIKAVIDTAGNDNAINLTNEGTIENIGDYGIYAEVKGTGENNKIIIKNTGKIQNTGDVGVYLGNGIASFENHGTIAPQGGSTAVEVRDYNTKLILGTQSVVEGEIKASGNTLYLVKTKDHEGNGILSGDITGLGNLIAKDGDWTLNGNVVLGHSDALKIAYEEVRDAEGNITIGESGTVKMIITSNQQPVLAANKISISKDGGIQYQVSESAYMASKSVDHLTSISFKEIEGGENITFDPLLEEAGKSINYYKDANGVIHVIMYDKTMDWEKIKEEIDRVVGAAPEPGPDPNPNPEPNPDPVPPAVPTLVGGYRQSIESYSQSNVDETASSLLSTKGLDNFRLNAINPDKAKLNNQYAEALISYGKYDANSGSSGYDYTSKGAAGGTYREIAPGFNIGLGYGYLKSEVNYNDKANSTQPSSNEDIDTFEIDLYASYRINNFLFNGYGSYSYNRHDLTRNVYDTVGKVYETEKSEFNSNIFKIGGEAGYIFNRDSFYIYPYAGISSKWYSRESYNESQTTSNGANDYSLKIGKSDYQTFLTTAGLIAARETSRERFVGRIAWDYQFDGRDNFDGTFNDANINNTWSIQGLKENKNLLKASLGYACKFTPSFEGGITFLLQANGKYHDRSAGVNINYSF